MSATRLRHLSVFSNPPGERFVAVLRAYFDESGKEEDPNSAVVAVAGLLAPYGKWDAFEADWRAHLVQWEIPYLHMKEFNKPDGPYKRFDASKDLKFSMLESFVMLYRKHDIFPVCHAIVKDHLRAWNKERDTSVSAYSLMLYGCLLEFSIKTGGVSCDLIIDRVEKAVQKVTTAQRYCKTDDYYKDILGWVGGANVSYLGDNVSFVDVVQIQAADFVAWELRYAINKELDFHLNVKSGDDPRVWREQKLAWDLKKFGKSPHARPSLFAFGSIAPVENGVWDYRMLDIAHKSRGGRW